MFRNPFRRPEPADSLEQAAISTLSASNRALATHLGEAAAELDKAAAALLRAGKGSAANLVKRQALHYRSLAQEWMG